MIRKMIPMKAKKWAIKTIRKAVFGGYSLPSILQYKPYRFTSDMFLIPRSVECDYETCSLDFAIPPKELWLGYGRTKEKWLATGEEHVSSMLELTKASAFSFTKGDRILDFGCGAGRMIRYLKNFAESCEIWGTDISAEHIYWCKQYLSPPFHFLTSTKIPHLPFEDRYFDFIYCGSVFTHIDDLAEAWLLELRRILSPKGRLYITIHDNHTIKLLDGPWENNELARQLKSNDLYNKSKDTLGMFVVGRKTGPNVFYDIEYFCRTLSSMFDVLSITPEAYGYQTAVLLKIKSNARD
jgi:SAM-dependent methyltransferase